MKLLKKSILPLSLGVVLISSTSIFANEIHNIDNIVTYDRLAKVEGDYITDYNYNNHIQLDDSHPYGRLHYYNNSSNEANMVVKIGSRTYIRTVGAYSGGSLDFSKAEGDLAAVEISSVKGTLNGRVWLASATFPSDFKN